MDNLKEYLLLHRTELDVDSPPRETWENIASRSDARLEARSQARLDDDSHGRQLPRPKNPANARKVRLMVRYVAAACLIGLAGIGSWRLIRGKIAPANTVKTERVTSQQETAVAKAADRAKPKIDSIHPQQSAAAGPIAPPRPTATPGSTATPPPTTTPAPIATPGQTAPPSPMAARQPVAPGRVLHKPGPQQEANVPDAISAIDKSYSTLIDYQLKKVRAMPLYAENAAYFSFYVQQFKQMDRDEAAVRGDIETYGLTGEFLEQMINVYQQKLNILKNLQTEINKMNNKVRQKQSPSAVSQVHYLNI